MRRLISQNLKSILGVPEFLVQVEDLDININELGFWQRMLDENVVRYYLLLI